MRIGQVAAHGFREGRGWRGAGLSGRFLVGFGSRLRSSVGCPSPMDGDCLLNYIDNLIVLWINDHYLTAHYKE